ncbi:MAG TPA: patatin-like phospholipase family protein [Bacteroidia bacterium]|nr:patatin-like phospholipase family protein [Bacteroidia bacterium]
MSTEPEIGLVLSGGGARGFAHLGVLQALDELGIRIAAISGTSAGAICGAFYFAGHRPQDTLRYIRSYKIYEWARILWRKPGILNMQKISEMFAKYLPDTFEGLDRPLTVCATDILKGCPEYFSSGPLTPAICASAAIPLVFEPVSMNGSSYVDGGILDNFPLGQLQKKFKTIIGVHVNPINHHLDHVHFHEVMDRSMHLALSPAVTDKKDQCSVFIEPKGCENFGMFDLSGGEKIFAIGYEAAMSVKKELLKL